MGVYNTYNPKQDRSVFVPFQVVLRDFRSDFRSRTKIFVFQSPRSHPFRGAPPLKGCGTPSRVRHPFRGAAPLEGRRIPDAAPQGVRAAACGKPLQSSSGSRGSAGRGFLFVVSLFFVVFCVMGKSNFAGSCFLEVRRVRI